MEVIVYGLMADLVALAHLLFVVFVVLGGWWLGRFPRLVRLHLPCVAWAVLLELFAWPCPLTPLEDLFRGLAGEAGHGGFVAHYLLPLIYPGQLTREIQIVLGSALVLLNVVVYAIVWRRVHGVRG